MARTFVPNPHFERALLRSSDAVAALEPAVAAVAGRAAELAPKRTENLADGIEGDVVLTDAGYVGRVVSTDFKTVWWELGHNNPHTGRFEHQPFLLPALDILG